MPDVLVRLPAIESTGPRQPRLLNDVDGIPVMVEGYAEPCPGCGRITKPGESISWLNGRWWHAEHAANRLTSITTSEAWYALGEALARRPRDYSQVEARAIITNLLALAARSLNGPDFEEPWMDTRAQVVT